MGGNIEARGENSGSGEYRVHRIATFGRKELARIMQHYTSELWGVEQATLSKEEVGRFELGRRAFGHLPHKNVYLIRKIDVYQTDVGIDDIRVKVFMEDEMPKYLKASEAGANEVFPLR